MRMMTRIAALAACLLALGPARGADAPAAANDRRVVFVTIDGLRWQEGFGGAQEAHIDRKLGGVQEGAELKARYLRGDTPEACASPPPATGVRARRPAPRSSSCSPPWRWAFRTGVHS